MISRLVSKLRPVQSAALQHSNKNLLIHAPFNSGKTLAYILPFLENQSSSESQTSGGSLLIVVPTSNHTQQVSDTLTRFIKKPTFPIKTVTLSSASEFDAALTDLSVLFHSKHSSQVPTIVIATPGRLTAAINLGKVSMDQFDRVVFDEADLLLSSPDVLKVVKQIPSSVLKTMASSSFDPWLKDVVNDLLGQYELVGEHIGSTISAFDPCTVLGVQHYQWELPGPLQAFDTMQSLFSGLEKLLESSEKKKAVVVASSETELVHLERIVTGGNGSNELSDDNRRKLFTSLSSCFVLADASESLNRQWFNHFKRTAVNAVLFTTDKAAFKDFSDCGVIVHIGKNLPSRRAFTERLDCLRTSRDDTVISIIALSTDTGSKSTQYELPRQLGVKPTKCPEDWFPSAIDVKERQVLDLIARIALNLKENPIETSRLSTTEHAGRAHALLSVAVDPVQLVLQAFMVLASGQSKVDHTISQFSGAKGFTPILLFDPDMKKLFTKKQVMNVIAESTMFKMPRMYKKKIEVGRIALSKRGFVVDVPYETASEIIKKINLKRPKFRAVFANPIPPLIEDQEKLRSVQRHKQNMRKKVRKQRVLQ